jgi:hypothetical protein
MIYGNFNYIYIYTDRYVVFKWNDVQFILFTEIKKKNQWMSLNHQPIKH